MKPLRSVRGIKLKKLCTAFFCWLAYLMLVLHGIIPHHHEEDIEHRHIASRYDDRFSDKHAHFGKSMAGDQCVLHIHHVSKSEDVVVLSFKKKGIIYSDFPPQKPALFITRYLHPLSYTPFASSTFHGAEQAFWLRGPPHA